MATDKNKKKTLKKQSNTLTHKKPKPTNKRKPKRKTAGQPPKWESVDEIEAVIAEYFKKTKIPKITLTGLCLALGTNKQTLANYEKKAEFKLTIEMAKLRIENAYELSLRKSGRTGDIFALKNFGWKDKQETEIYGKDGGSIDTVINIIPVTPKPIHE
jgi:hypothetical protein